MKRLLCILFLAFFVAACGETAQAPTPVPTTQPAAQATQAPTAQATQAPTQAATTQPTQGGQQTVTHGTPHIGGPKSDFIGKYGQPTTMNGGWVLDEEQNTIVFANVDASGTVTKVTLVTLASWDMATTKEHCAPFLPPDASQFNDAGNFIDYHSSVGEVVMLLYAGSCVLTIGNS